MMNRKMNDKLLISFFLLFFARVAFSSDKKNKTRYDSYAH